MVLWDNDKWGVEKKIKTKMMCLISKKVGFVAWIWQFKKGLKERILLLLPSSRADIHVKSGFRFKSNCLARSYMLRARAPFARLRMCLPHFIWFYLYRCVKRVDAFHGGKQIYAFFQSSKLITVIFLACSVSFLSMFCIHSVYAIRLE